MKSYHPTTHHRKRRAADEAAAPSGEHTATPAQSLATLRQPQLGGAERARAALGMQRVVGNAAVGRELSTSRATPRRASGIVIQRDPVHPASEPAHSEQSQSPQSTELDALVQAEIEQFLDRFSHIEVTVSWMEKGETHTRLVQVHPPYFMSSKRHKRSKERLEAALAEREEMGKDFDDLVAGHAHAKVGKSTPEDIQSILQAAVDQHPGRIQPGPGKKYPDATDMRQWLITYGIGIDCSGFVSQALNEVMSQVYGRPLKKKERLNKGSSELKGGNRTFERVEQPDQIRSGDTMHIEGHIRIVTSKQQTSEGYIQFTTAESHAGKQDIGLDSASWRYKDMDQYKRLEKYSGNKWHRSKEKPTFGRYRALIDFEAETTSQ